MPRVQTVTSVAAGAVNANLIAGSVYELPDRHYWGRLALTAEAAGESRVTVQVGDKVQLEESSVSRANRIPILPDDILLDRFPCPRGKRIVIKGRNTGAGANTIFVTLDLTPA